MKLISIFSTFSFVIIQTILGVSNICAQVNNTPKVYSSYFGGNKNDWGNAICQDKNGDIIVAMATFSTNLPLLNEVQAENKGLADIYISKFKPDMKTLLFSTYFGGSGWDGAIEVTTDTNGNIFILGKTLSEDFPVTENAYCNSYKGGNSDAVLVKMDTSGKVVYSSYFGGSGDELFGICLDDSQNIYISGVTSSTDMPIKNALNTSLKGGKDAFLAKFKQDDLSLIFSTYIGGSSDESDVSVFCGENIIVFGTTKSVDFYTKNAYNSEMSGTSDGFIMEIDKSGSEILMSTYFGSNGEEGISDLILDGNNNYIFTGHTSSNNINCTETAISDKLTGGTDIFFAKLNFDNSGLSYFTYIGGSANDWAHRISMIDNTSFYLLGKTRSGNFPISFNAYQDVYKGHDDEYEPVFGDIVLMKISLQTDILIYSTYIGGSKNEGGHYDMVVDDSMKVFISGHSTSSDFPVSNDAAQKSFLGGNCDAVLLKFEFGNSTSSIDASSYGPINIYPVPFENEIILDYENNSSVLCTYKLISLEGKLIKYGQLNHSNTLQLSDVKKGTYILLLTTPNNIFAKKIIK